MILTFSLTACATAPTSKPSAPQNLGLKAHDLPVQGKFSGSVMSLKPPTFDTTEGMFKIPFRRQGPGLMCQATTQSQDPRAILVSFFRHVNRNQGKDLMPAIDVGADLTPNNNIFLHLLAPQKTDAGLLVLRAGAMRVSGKSVWCYGLEPSLKAKQVVPMMASFFDGLRFEGRPLIFNARARAGRLGMRSRGWAAGAGLRILNEISKGPTTRQITVVTLLSGAAPADGGITSFTSMGSADTKTGDPVIRGHYQAMEDFKTVVNYGFEISADRKTMLKQSKTTEKAPVQRIKLEAPFLLRRERDLWVTKAKVGDQITYSALTAKGVTSDSLRVLSREDGRITMEQKSTMRTGVLRMTDKGTYIDYRGQSGTMNLSEDWNQNQATATTP